MSDLFWDNCTSNNGSYLISVRSYRIACQENSIILSLGRKFSLQIKMSAEKEMGDVVSSVTTNNLDIYATVTQGTN